jgi:hypothetical protein
MRGLVGAALGESVGDHAVSLVKAMTDFYTWKALAAEGLRDQAPAIVTRMLLNHLGIEE